MIPIQYDTYYNLDTGWVGSLLPLMKLWIGTMYRMDETLKLIEVRSAMEDQFAVEKKKRKSVWKDTATLLEQQGFKRTPEQCSSMWSSMVKKYEVETSSLSALLFTCSINLFIAFTSRVRWGPLYTMAKLCDHEMARALEIHLNAVSWEAEIEFCVITGLQV